MSLDGRRMLDIFMENRKIYISGEALSRRFGCSRTAVWKQIRRLQQEGYEFEAVPRKGYRLTGEPDLLKADRIEDKLETRIIGRKLLLYKQLASTQTTAHKQVAEGANEGTAVLAEEQTEGRGRMGRKWHSPVGKGIWMSLILKPQIPLPHAPQLTLLTAVALCRTIKKALSIDIGIKWPNDLLIRGKKVCGILLESSAEDERLRYVIAGIGISANLQLGDFPDELLDKATSLSMECGRAIDRESLIASFFNEFESIYDLYHEQGFAPIRILWEALSVSLQRPIRIRTPQGFIEGMADSIDEYGALHVRKADGSEVKMYAGEVE